MSEEPTAPVVVHVASSPLAAEVVRAKLASFGIPAALSYESAGRVLGLVVDGWGETRVLVPAGRAEEAMRVLQEEEA